MPVGALWGQDPGKLRSALADLPLVELQSLADSVRFDWSLWARDKQIEPAGAWRYWVILAGRGFGKTRTGAEWIRAAAESGKYRWLSIIGPTREAVYKIMLKGPAGLLHISPPWFRPKMIPSRNLIEYPNGVQVRYFSAERPDRLRGPEHERIWADEPAAWPKLEESLTHLDMGLRLGEEPRMLLTTTPRPRAGIVDLVLGPKDADGNRVRRPDVVVTKGISEENRANLAHGSIEAMRSRYGNSRMARQELDAELLEKTGTELWNEVQLRACRVPGVPCQIVRLVVAVDPTRSDSPTDEAGIIVAGLGEDGSCYVLEDCSLRASPHGWTQQAVAAYHKHRADALVYEQNRMGKTAELVMRTTDRAVKWKAVMASTGKRTRAEPVSALYEQGRVRHVGRFDLLEDEMCTWDPAGPSPNRMDALVWAVTELLLGEQRAPLILR